MYQYRCTVRSWVDGDTLDVDVDLGFYVTLRQRVRVDGINCPESRTRDKTERAAGMAAKGVAAGLIPLGSVVTIQTAKAARPSEKFGRWLATITLAGGQDFAAKMLELGHAKPYHGEARIS